MYKLICQKPTHFLSAQMFIVLGMYTFVFTMHCIPECTQKWCGLLWIQGIQIERSYIHVLMWPKRGRGQKFSRKKILYSLYFCMLWKMMVSSRDSLWKSFHSIIHIFVPKSDIDEARQDTWYAWYISRELIIYLSKRVNCHKIICFI